MNGLIGSGQAYRNIADGALEDAERLETARRVANKQAKAAEKQGNASLAGTGAVLGWAAGAKAGSVGGVWGALAGAAIGYLAGEFL